MKIWMLPLLLLAGPVAAQETKTYNYRCKGGSFSLTATIDRSKGYEAWADGSPVILRIPGQPPEALVEDKSDGDHATWRNRNYMFYSFKKFTNLSRIVGGREKSILDACR